jgi:hypothetical protein
MNFLEALFLVNWANDHPPAIAAPIPERLSWAVSIRVAYVNVTTGTESYDRHVVRNRADARAVLGY